MTRSTYRRLKIVWFAGSAALIAVVVAGWLHLIPFWIAFTTIILIGGPAAFAGWVLHDQDFEELPE